VNNSFRHTCPVDKGVIILVYTSFYYVYTNQATPHTPLYGFECK
jgi:hypothetical protein